MELGTTELVEENPDSEPAKRSRLGRGSGSTSGGNDGSGGGGGSNGPSPEDTDDQDLTPEKYPPEKTRILTGFLLVVVMMTFGGLIAAYVVISTNNVAEWQPTSLPIQVWISTAVIIASSITYFFAERAVKGREQEAGKRFLIATTVLGAIFISSQLLSWVELTQRGLYLKGNPYVGFFYLLTAVHAVHVLGGMVALSSILLRSWHPARTEETFRRRANLAQVVGWYWHFMGVLWIVLFILLGFWK